MFQTKEELQIIINNNYSPRLTAIAEATLAAFEAHKALDTMLSNELNRQG